MILLLLLVGCVVGVMQMGGGGLEPAEIHRRIEGGKAVLVDVREPDEWEQGVATPAILLSLSDLRGQRLHWKPFLQTHADKEILLYCRSGNRSGVAAAILAKEGFKTTNAGSYAAWKKAGLPTALWRPSDR